MPKRPRPNIIPSIGGKCKILWKFTAEKIVNKPKKIITFDPLFITTDSVDYPSPYLPTIIFSWYPTSGLLTHNPGQPCTSQSPFSIKLMNIIWQIYKIKLLSYKLNYKGIIL